MSDERPQQPERLLKHPGSILERPLVVREAALRSFIHGFPSGSERARGTLAFVLTLWQLAARKLVHHVPWLALVHEDPPNDQLNRLVGELASFPGTMEPPPAGGHYLNGQPDLAKGAIWLHAVSPPSIGDRAKADIQRIFGIAVTAAFGSGNAGHYGDRFHPDTGWITGTDPNLILRVENDQDHEAFRADLLGKTDKLHIPLGIARQQGFEQKILSISGSFSPQRFQPLWRILMENHPAVLIPHRGGPVRLDRPLELGLFASQFPPSIQRAPVIPVLRLPESTPVAKLEAALRARLALLPASYEFLILLVLRQLCSLCQMLEGCAGDPKGDPKLVGWLAHDLYLLCLRGLQLATEGLGYFVLWDLPAGVDVAEARRMLEAVRDSGPITKRELQRKLRLPSAASRDEQLEALVAAGLAQTEGTEVRAVALGDYLEVADRRHPELEPRLRTTAPAAP